ncbi:L-rhamnose mutarotase [Piscinibacter gummiphilus]|uniref:L-rhamnose mutarotase n=1 Tax=Piscinibacter gummiphilus TaxID=946333 RepID=A0A1W6L2Q2_9BURK|nr:L-rhamnose mutarotase [Piscinibacter gummiphilus]ARN18466.1 L-rhamnose mutarotase [Piscinibacter gummiphilus]ATU63094.1 L-rhamnose mutarotase [Piscinibacter gummiphilus]GLS95403.1 L-rhamnose mutarotase [Piscinibacter gummiphilus]
MSTTTEKIAFRMFLNPGAQVEYRRRHAAIWPELVTLLKASGIEDYSIYLDEAHGTLFAVLRRVPGHTMDDLPKHPVMQRWWQHMADLMRTNPDGSPVVERLPLMFHLA